METNHSLFPLNRPLRYDEDGNLRILLVGNCGAGKVGWLISYTRAHDLTKFQSTIAEKLSSILELPVIHLDALYYKPKWQGVCSECPGDSDATLTVVQLREIPEDEFCSIVKSFISQNKSWIIDGDYEPVADLVNAAATCILCGMIPFTLDHPRHSP